MAARTEAAAGRVGQAAWDFPANGDLQSATYNAGRPQLGSSFPFKSHDPLRGWLCDVIEKILRGHRRAAMVGGLWYPTALRAPLPAGDGVVHDPDSASGSQRAPSGVPRELTYVDIDTFLATL